MDVRRHRTRVGGIACIAMAAASLLAVTPATADAKPLVVAPKGGERVESAPVRVSVRAPWRKDPKVHLSGASVTREFAAADAKANGRRTVRVGASHGLVYGENVVRVKRGKRSQTVRFKLTRERPLVGAGRDRRIHVGRSIRLNGSASRVREAGRGSAEGLEMSWELVRKPAGSDAELDDAVQAARPLLAPDEPGRYVAELVVGDDGAESVADRVTADALLATPLVPIDTAASVGGQAGIAVGYHPAENGGRAPQGTDEEFFPLGSGDALQLVVLNRETLETLKTWSGPASIAGVQQLTGELDGFEDDALVIVTAWRSGAWPAGSTDALTGHDGQGVEPIGAYAPSTTEIDSYGVENGGQLSWVGVPGFPAGEAWETGGGASDALRGFLSPDSDENYAYLGTGPGTYDLGPTGQGATVQVGPTQFSAEPLPAGEGGFYVGYLDGVKLELTDAPGVPSEPKVYTTRTAAGGPNYDGIYQLVSDLGAAAEAGQPVVVALRSLGSAPLPAMGLQPPKYEGTFDPDLAAALNALAASVAAVGGHEQGIYGMSTQPTGDDSYALLGSNYARNEGLGSEGSGVDAGSQLAPTSQTRVAGIVARDKRSRYVPKASTNGPVGAALAELTVAEPVDWPFSQTPGELAALECIGNAQGLGPDPRVAYWMQSYDSDRWSQIQGEISAMQSSACPSVDATDFTNVRDELAKEIGWLVDVRSYLGALSAPFTDEGLSSYADLNSITQDVVVAVTPPPVAPAGIDPLAIFADIADILDVADVPGAGAVAGALFLASDLTTDSQDGPTIDWAQKVEAQSDVVGQQLANQVQTIAEQNEHLVDIIAADYAKLSTVGALGQCTPGAPGCEPEWQFTQDQQNAASRAYEISAERQAWGGLFPAAYPYVLYTNSNPGSYNGDFEGPQEQISGIECEFAIAFDVEEPVFLRYGIRQVANTPFMVFSQTNFKGADPKKGTLPPNDVLSSPAGTRPPFAPLDPGGDPDKGGLGLDRYEFMIDNWALTGLGGGNSWRGPWRGC